MKQQIKNWFLENGKELKKFTIFLVVITIFYSVFLMDHFAVDTYYLQAHGYVNNAMDPFFKDGRLIETLFLIAMRVFHIPFFAMKVISWLWGTLSLTIACYITYRMFDKYCKNKLLHYLVSFGVVVNVFVLEFYMFPELTGDMCFGILMTVCTGALLVKFFETKNWKQLILASVCAMVSASCYQGVLSLTVLIPILFVKKYSNNMKEFILNNLSIMVPYASASIFTLIVTKMNGASRLNMKPVLSDTLLALGEGIKNLLSSTYNFFPPYIYLSLIVVTIIIVLFGIYKAKAKAVDYAFFFYILLAIMIVPIIPYCILHASKVWVVPRSCLGYGAIVGLVIAFYCLYFQQSKVMQKGLIIIFLILFSFQYRSALIMGRNRSITNAMDMSEAKQIAEIIYKYEQKNKITIHKIVKYYDNSTRYGYENTLISGDVIVRAMSSSWASEDLIELVLNRDLNSGKEDEKFKEKCGSKNYNYFEPEQIKLDDSTLHICIY